MNPQGPVLRDIHPPPPPSWWPPAYGWWVLGAVVLVSALVLVIWLLRRQARARRWRSIDQEMSASQEVFARTGDVQQWLADLSAWLRRAARLRDPDALHLEGKAWSAYLQEHAPRGVDPSVFDTLQQALYDPDSRVDPEVTIAAVRDWVRKAVREARHV